MTYVWFGRSALKQHQELNPESPLAEISVYVARDGVGQYNKLVPNLQSAAEK